MSAFRTLLLGAVLLLPACQPQSPVALSPADEQALRQADAAVLKAIQGKDWPGLAAAFAEDGTILPANGETVTGRAAIQAWAEAFPPMNSFSGEPVKIDGRGDLAYIRGRYSMSLTPPGAAAAVEDRGKYLVIWRKQADGSWKVEQDMWNSDLAAAAPPAPAASAQP